MASNFFQRLLIAPLAFVPESIAWRLSQRYVAGTSLKSALDAVTKLNNLNCSATIDALGEDSATQQEAEAARDLYIEALDEIVQRNLNCNASVKLSDLGLRLDSELCFAAMEKLVSKAQSTDNFIRIDMEDSSVTTQTLEVYRRLRKSYDNVGTVVQACLRRTQKDVEQLLDEGLAHIRLCKGIYVEPESIAFSDANDIRTSFKALVEFLLEQGAQKVGIATHDPILIDHAEKTIARLSIDQSRYEFQMLLGVAGTLRSRLVEKGHPLRVYVPFGERWYAYSMRRLRENPRIAIHIVRNLFSGH